MANRPASMPYRSLSAFLLSVVMIWEPEQCGFKYNQTCGIVEVSKDPALRLSFNSRILAIPG